MAQLHSESKTLVVLATLVTWKDVLMNRNKSELKAYLQCIVYPIVNGKWYLFILTLDSRLFRSRIHHKFVITQCFYEHMGIQVVTFIDIAITTFYLFISYLGPAPAPSALWRRERYMFVLQREINILMLAPPYISSSFVYMPQKSKCRWYSVWCQWLLVSSIWCQAPTAWCGVSSAPCWVCYRCSLWRLRCPTSDF